MSGIAAGTIAAKNYIAFARVLARSFLRRHPDVPFFVVLADEVDGRFEPHREPFRLLSLGDLAIPHLERFRFRYTLRQVAVAAKPYLLAHLLDRGYRSAVFLDPDILVVRGLDALLAEVARHAVTLTPHVSAQPSGATRVARELNILRAGVFNGGFVGASDTPCARSFLAWWRERLSGHCRYAVENGLHYDQRWLDLAPAFVEDLAVVRDPAYNVAYWNLAERDLRGCRFFHFSGFDPARPESMTKYAPDLAVPGTGPVARLFGRYRTLLEDAGHAEAARWPYAYGFFDNGVPVPGIAREIYAGLGEEAGRFGDPLAAAPPGSFFRWLRAPDGGGHGVSRLWKGVYDRREDVRLAFPDLAGAGRAGFLRWMVEFGAREHGIPDAFLAG